MSNKSRRANTSRRRVSMAAGALLAGAAIPIAAAGAAWADDSSDKAGTPAPAIPGAPSPVSFVAPATAPVDMTQNFNTLTGEGFTSAQATAILNAEGLGAGGPGAEEAVEASVNGKVVVEVDEGSGTAGEAIAKSSNHGISAAIGGGSESTGSGTKADAFTDGNSLSSNSDSATAVGAGATASNTGSTGTAVKADGTDAAASASGDTVYTNPTNSKTTDNTVTATDAHATASSTGDSGVKVTATGLSASATSTGDIASTVTADGTSSTASASDFTGSTVSAIGKDTQAEAGDSVQGTNVTVKADGTDARAYGSDVTGTVSAADKITATGTDSVASVNDTIGDSFETGPNNTSTTISTNSTVTAIATGADSSVYAIDVTAGDLVADGVRTSAQGTDDSGGTTVMAVGTEAQSSVSDSSNSIAITKDDPDPTNTEATGANVEESTGSAAYATDPRSQAQVDFGTDITETAVGGQSKVYDGQQMVTPAADVHVESSIALP